MRGDQSPHIRLRNDFRDLLARDGLNADLHPEVIANRLVHLVVLHGLLPETEER